ncbi:MAG: RluA family pseudouridine synthase [Burkholderiaceae bacterium]|nr:RluA family pseudouridine synthase [Burkholderiaceae bacterium]
MAAAARAEVVWLTVDAESAGQRLDNFLLRHLKGVPKTHVYRIIRSGEVRLNKGRAAAASRVSAGDVVRVPPVRVAARADAAAALALPLPPAREFPVLLEDDCLLAIDKPAGVAVHGGSGVSFGVIEQLRRARPQARFLELVHRLDRETSGILLLAKKRGALKALQAQFRNRQTGKTYLALVLGQWSASRRVIDAPLRKHLIENGERRVKITTGDDADGMRAITLVRVARRLADMTLLEVSIKTGRTHQIRVHLASCGHPIAGDDKYGDFERNKALQKQGLKRMFLHAWKLRFEHPATDPGGGDQGDDDGATAAATAGAPVQLQAPLPPDLQQFLSSLKPALP